MQTLARKPMFAIGLVAFAAAFAALWLFAGSGAVFGAKPDGGGGGNAASNKAVFSKHTTEAVSFAKFMNNTELACDGTGFELPNTNFCTEWITLYDLTDALKTSTQGALEAEVSLECMLSTDSSAAAKAVAGANSVGSGGSRAGIEVRVMFDGQVAEPSNVVFCDRLQWLELTVPALTDSMGGSVTSEDEFIVRLFQRTKNSHSFNFYKGMAGVDLHDIKVEVRGIIVCSKDGMQAACDDAGLTFADVNLAGGTKMAIGKSTLVVEEHNNWAEMDAGTP